MSFISIFVLKSCAQEKPSKEDYVSRENANILVQKYLEKEITDKNYVVFSTDERNYLVIIEQENFYSEYFFVLAKDNSLASKLSNSVKKPNAEYLKIFDKSIYRRDFVTFNTDFYKDGYDTASGSITYFVLRDKQGKSYGESRLSVFVKPNPIDAKVYVYLINRILYFTSLIN